MFKENKEGTGGGHPSPEKSLEVAENTERDKTSEKHEVVHEGVVGKVIEAVRLASPNAIIFLNGLAPHEYTEIMAALAEEKKGVTLIDRSRGENIGAVRTEVAGRIFDHPKERI